MVLNMQALVSLLAFGASVFGAMAYGYGLWLYGYGLWLWPRALCMGDGCDAMAVPHFELEYCDTCML